MKFEYAIITLFGIFVIVGGIQFLLEGIRKKEYRQIAYGLGMVVSGIALMLIMIGLIFEIDKYKLPVAIIAVVGVGTMAISYYTRP